jgi:HepT-like protein
MTVEELKDAITVEFAALQQVAHELESLRTDVACREPTVRERTAAAAFLAQFYTGIENILKRLSRFHGVGLPVGENWHFELFKRFCSPEQPPLPLLFDEVLARQLGPFRRFRHVVHHGYGFQIDWGRMHEGLEKVPEALVRFRSRVEEHLKCGLT